MLDVLSTWKLIRNRSHVAAALNVVLPAQRINARPVTSDVTAEQRKIDKRTNVVDGIVMLRYAESPAELRAWRFGVCVRQLGDERGRHAGCFLRVLERVRLDRRAIFVKPARRMGDEVSILQGGREDFAPDRIGERDIGADVESKPTVGPLCARRPAWIDDVELCAVMDSAENVMEEDRMRLSGVRTPENDRVGALDLLVRTRPAAGPEYRRQTDDARGVSSPVAAIDVIAAHDRTSELLCDVVHLVGSLRAAKHSEGARTVALACTAKGDGRAIEGFIPGGAAQLAAITH